MNVYILFGLRKEGYAEQYAPEALEVMDQHSYDVNSEWLHEKLKEHEAHNSFVALKIMLIDLGAGSQEHIRELLIGTPKLKGTVKEPV